jgi:methionine synthase II (cobalamin-independent)
MEARTAHSAGTLEEADFKAVEDRAVREAIALQEQAGIGVITDGELRRYAFYGHLIEAVEGFDKFGGWEIGFRDDSGDKVTLKRPVVVEKLRFTRSLCAEEWTYLRAVTSHSAKVTMPSAQQTAAFYDPSLSADAYTTQEAFLADVVSILRQEVAELKRLGCTYVQLDAPQYAALLDPEIREGYRKRGNDPDALIDRCVEMDNAIIDGHPGMTFGLHICRGNHRSRYLARGGYEPIQRVFNRSRFNRFLLEFDDERSGGFEPLSVVPHDRVVILGLVSTKRAKLEDPRELQTRVQEAARLFPLEQMGIGPQCGFASQIEGNLVTQDDQRRKLVLAAQVAGEIWG